MGQLKGFPCTCVLACVKTCCGAMLDRGRAQFWRLACCWSNVCSGTSDLSRWSDLCWGMSDLSFCEQRSLLCWGSKLAASPAIAVLVQSW
uniref:Putative secreted protein n=1 Tax=Ixodes ricinus TaxID=34613 RepID=A0A6B0UCQ0_IXORI